MTERLYYHDSYLQTFNAQVISLSDDGLRVVLDRTAFYPTSGGQPNDIGVLNGIPVIDVIDREETIEHVLQQPLRAHNVNGSVDWARRLDHMQQHTAQHLLSAVMQEEFSFETVSFHLGTEESTVDVEPGQMSPETILAIEVRANQRLRQNLATSVSFEDAAIARDLRKQSEREGVLRIVSIAGLDRSACGGTHVAHTGELGLIRLGKTEKIRKALRIYFYAGERAYAFTMKQLTEAKAETSQLRERLAESDKPRQRILSELASLRGVQRFQSTAPNAQGIRLWVESIPEVNEATRLEANAFLANSGAALLLYDPASGALLLGASESTSLDCGKAFKQAAASHGWKGGGSSRLAQGNIGPDADLTSLSQELLASLI